MFTFIKWWSLFDKNVNHLNEDTPFIFRSANNIIKIIYYNILFCFAFLSLLHFILESNISPLDQNSKCKHVRCNQLLGKVALSYLLYICNYLFIDKIHITCQPLSFMSTVSEELSDKVSGDVP